MSALLVPKLFSYAFAGGNLLGFANWRTFLQQLILHFYVHCMFDLYQVIGGNIICDQSK